MSTRSIHFFMRRAEFASIAWEVASKLGATLLLARLDRQQPVEVAHRPGLLVMANGAPADWVYIAVENSAVEPVYPSSPNVAQLGWVRGRLPLEEGNTLFQAGLDARSDWYDLEQRRVQENPASVVLFDRVAPFFRRQLRRPVWVYDLRTGPANAKPYRIIGYSEGVVEWVQQGGKLRQTGVANVGYVLSHPSSEQAFGKLPEQRVR